MSLLSTSSGTLIKVTEFKSSGTWYKQVETKRIFVELVGGGGGGGGSNPTGGNGGSSSFGSFISGGGGIGGMGSTGGSGSGGDINISGTNGVVTATAFGNSGTSFLSPMGNGGDASGSGTYTRSGGGGGGYSAKLITNPDLPSSESVTVGGGGEGVTGGKSGQSGIVIIYEYA